MPTLNPRNPPSNPPKAEGPVQDSVKIRMNNRDFTLSFAQAFAYGHTLLRIDKIETAAALFEYLVQKRPNDRQANVMLARCKARLAEYEACKQILNRSFEGESGPIAERLHTAFVYRALGRFPDAREELLSIVEAHPDVPSACLALGDLFEKVGRPDKAEKMWMLAARRDPVGGSITRSVVSQLSILKKSLEQSRRARKPAPGSGSGPFQGRMSGRDHTDPDEISRDLR